MFVLRVFRLFRPPSTSQHDSNTTPVNLFAMCHEYFICNETYREIITAWRLRSWMTSKVWMKEILFKKFESFHAKAHLTSLAHLWSSTALGQLERNEIPTSFTWNQSFYEVLCASVWRVVRDANVSTRDGKSSLDEFIEPQFSTEAA